MANVFGSSNKENSLFKDERFLYPDFVPEVLPFRDKEISELVFCLKPASLGRKPVNVFVFGKPGTGKTVTLRFVLNELEEFSDRAKGIYINCFQFSTKQAILSKLCNVLGYAVSERGLSFEELWTKFIAVIKSKKIIPILVFDEAEKMLGPGLSDLLYEFSRIGEQHKVILGLAFISNDEYFLSKIDDRVRSSLQCSSISFEPYDVLELKEILEERVKYAFNSFALDSDVVGLCAAHAAKLGGDARIAVSVLLKAGRLAEKENSKKISVSHVRASFMQEKPVKVEVSSTYSVQEQEILTLLDKNSAKEIDSSFIYSSLSSKFSERALRYALSSLESKKVIVSEKKVHGRGFTRVFKRK